MTLRSRIRIIQDCPKKGVVCRDITTLLQDPVGLRVAVDQLAYRYSRAKIDKVAGIEARGFIFGAPLAYLLGVGFVPIRKKGKLPSETVRQDYEHEYGTDRIEVHSDAIKCGEKVLLMDDMISTGCVADAATKLIAQLGGEILECAFVIDQPGYGGSQKLKKKGFKVFALCKFEEEGEVKEWGQPVGFSPVMVVNNDLRHSPM
jgi:adenine phosphoribosyltransferase